MTESGATDVPADAIVASPPIPRRDVLKGIVGIAGLGLAPGLLAACGTTGTAAAPAVQVPAVVTTAPSGAVASVAATASGNTPRLSLASWMPVGDLLDRFREETGIVVDVETVIAGDFGDRIQTYLTGAPDDVMMGVTGYDMRLQASQGLLTSIDDVWAKVDARFSDAVKRASTGDDGHRYAIPFAQAPWALMYQHKLFDEHGYKVPTTWDALRRLARRMTDDGIVPFAFGNKDQFPALGWFDLIDMRQNGSKFHMDLLAGRERWTDPRVKAVFERWLELFPYMQPKANLRGVDEAARSLARHETGMFLCGLFGASWIQDENQPAYEDLDMFAFPDLGTPYDAEKAIDGPFDAFLMTRRSPTLADDLDNAKAFMGFMAGERTQAELNATAFTISPALHVDTTGYSQVQQTATHIMKSAGFVAQFLDRDTDGAFAYKLKVLFQDLVGSPRQDLAAFLARIQAAWPDA